MVNRTSTALRGQEITAITGRAGYQPKLSRQACYERKLVEGRFDCLEYTEGLSVHLSDLTELVDVTSQATLSPQVSFIVLLAGELEFSVDDTPVHLASSDFEVRCAAMVLRSSAILRRHLRAGTKVSKVHVTVTPAWLEKHCSDLAQAVWGLALDRHNELPVWSASSDITTAAKAILVPSDKPACLQKLFVENQALVIVSEGLAALHRLPRAVANGGRRVHQVKAVQAYLDAHLAEPLSLSAVGRLFGMSASTLQRYFKQTLGVTVGDYVRSQRLTRARRQLLTGQASIGEAAFAAGYVHTTNFITAYKRLFGCSPGQEISSGIEREL